MSAWLVVAKKEVIEQLRSKRTLVTIVVVPILVWIGLAGMYAIILGGLTTGGPFATPIDVYLTVEDKGPYGVLVQQAVVNASKQVNARVHEVTVEEAQRLIEEGDVVLYIRVPENFTATLNASHVGVLEIWLDPTSQRANLVLGQVMSVVQDVVEAPENQLVVQVRRIRHAPTGFLIASFILVMSAIYGPLPVVTTSFAGERERKTLEVLLATPVERRSILTGKLAAAGFTAAVYIVANLIGMGVYAGIMKVALEQAITPGVAEFAEIGLAGVTWWQMGVILAAVGLTVLMAAAVGVVISSLARSVRDAETYFSAFFMLPVMLMAINIGTRLEDLPFAVQALIYAIPFSHGALLINNALIYNKPWPILAASILYMVATIAIAILIGAKLFEREEIVETRKPLRRRKLRIRFLGAEA
mgnify:CR=1 FL=1